MIVRPADIEKDQAAILEGAWDFASRLDHAEFLPARSDAFEAGVMRVIGLDCVEVTVAEHDGAIVGGLGVAYTPYLWNPVLTHADELFWWTAATAPTTTALRLIRTVLDRARKKAPGQVIGTFKMLTSSPPKIAGVYERLGLRKTETAFMGVI